VRWGSPRSTVRRDVRAVWMNLQVRYDLEVEKDRLGERLEREVKIRG